MATIFWSIQDSTNPRRALAIILNWASEMERIAPPPPPPRDMTLAAGSKRGPYDDRRAAGRRRDGEVYLSLDPRLEAHGGDRFLPAQFFLPIRCGSNVSSGSEDHFH